MHSISPNREPRTSVRLFTVFQPALPSLKRSLYVCSSLQRLSGLAQHVGFGKLKNIFLIRSNHVTLCYALCNRLVNLFRHFSQDKIISCHQQMYRQRQKHPYRASLHHPVHKPTLLACPSDAHRAFFSAHYKQ